MKGHFHTKYKSVATFLTELTIGKKQSLLRSDLYPGYVSLYQHLYGMDSNTIKSPNDGEFLYDAVIVPGGGLEPGTNLPHSWVRSRLDAAIKLYSRTQYIIVLSRGTTHRPSPRDSRQFPVSEAEASAKYLIVEGKLDPSRILLDSWSLDTIGNAAFARSMLCDPLHLQKLCVITSEFHMPRTRKIFDWVFSLDDGHTVIDYFSTPDEGMTTEQSAARRSKEEASLKTLVENTIPNTKTLLDLTRFLFIHHGAYNADAVVLRDLRSSHKSNDEDKPDPMLQTY